MRKLILLITLCISGTFLYYSCKDTPTGDDSNNKITGTIQNLGGTPVQNATVTLKIKNISTTSNASGLFEIDPSAALHPNEDKSSQNDVVDTLVITHNDYLYKRIYLYALTGIINVKIWDTKFYITDEITGWVDQPEYFVAFDTIQLYELIDGGDELYIGQGLIDGILQELKKGTDNTCDVYLFNFGTAQKATNMFTEQSNNVSTPVLISGYDESIAVGKEFIGGAIIYAHFNKFEIELSFMGYSDIEQLKADAAIFIQVYESKISNIHFNN